MVPAAVAKVAGADHVSIAAFNARGAHGALGLDLVPSELPFAWRTFAAPYENAVRHRIAADRVGLQPHPTRDGAGRRIGSGEVIGAGKAALTIKVKRLTEPTLNGDGRNRAFFLLEFEHQAAAGITGGVTVPGI